MCCEKNIGIFEIQKNLNRLKIRDEKGQKLTEDGLTSENYYFVIKEFQRITQVQEMEILRATEMIISKPLIRLGDNNFIIKYLQWFFKVKIDGKFDLKTQAEVIRFQSKKLISTDGIIGKETWKKILG